MTTFKPSTTFATPSFSPPPSAPTRRPVEPPVDPFKERVRYHEDRFEFDEALKLLAGEEARRPGDAWIAGHRERCELTRKALGIARGEPIPPEPELRALIKALKDAFLFGIASRVLRRARDAAPGAPLKTWLVQQLALCTYKDDELHPGQRLDDALALLEGLGLRDAGTRDAETLALGGAVLKRRWEYGGQIEDLHESLAFYRAAWERNPDQDNGCGGVNAAYLLDLLASRARAIAERSGTKPEQAGAWGAQARAIREAVLTHLDARSRRDPDLLRRDPWISATLAEACFGLARYEEAGRYLRRYLDGRPGDWQRQTTLHRLTAVARLRGVRPPREGVELDAVSRSAWAALRPLLDRDSDVLPDLHRGKIGLALSGGGFRAALFHLGVLARLAETDLLRGVEVLSTVSGGSIVGALYYLALRRKLETMTDDALRRSPTVYVEIVREVMDHFIGAIQNNLRMRVLANPFKNVKMLFERSYSRSTRMGELFETWLYRPFADGASSRPVRMRDLLIRPLEAASATPGDARPDADFNPRSGNWRRRAKAPILLLNATTLNSGHGWHFTARSMGEPPALAADAVDANRRYRRLWYTQAPTEALRDCRLGDAVAASACVPALFDPLVIKGLYRDAADPSPETPLRPLDHTVRLVDGGVYDNQGVQGLLDEGCTVILCSDASGQLDDQPDPPDGLLGVPLRANTILMDRVREAQYMDLRARIDSRALRGLFFVHLKKDLAAPPVEWIDCQDPSAPPSNARNGNRTPYGIDRSIQGRLAALRTDLDTFTEVEACALMLSGYLMTEEEIKRLANRAGQDDASPWRHVDEKAARGDWAFLKLEEVLKRPAAPEDEQRQDVERQLEAGSNLLFKAWILCRPLRWVAGVLAAATVCLSGCLLWRYWDARPFPAPSVGALALGLLVLAACAAVPALKWLRPRAAMRGLASKLALAVLGCAISNLHLYLFDPLFLRRGRLARLLKLPGARPPSQASGE